MKPVRWTKTADEDRVTKVRTQAVRDELRVVATTSLEDPPGAYGGEGAGPLLWRRGVTAATRRALEAAERSGHNLDDGQEHAWDYTLVYFSKWRAGRSDVWVIVSVLTLDELFAGFTALCRHHQR